MGSWVVGAGDRCPAWTQRNKDKTTVFDIHSFAGSWNFGGSKISALPRCCGNVVCGSNPASYRIYDLSHIATRTPLVLHLSLQETWSGSFVAFHNSDSGDR